MKQQNNSSKFKAIFETQKNEILASHLLASEEFQVKVEDLSDENDHASAVIEQGMRMSLRNREVNLLKKIDLSLAKIRLGTFGVCECCEEDIELSRLEARPTAELCLECKETAEINESKSSRGRQSKVVGISLELQTA